MKVSVNSVFCSVLVGLSLSTMNGFAADVRYPVDDEVDALMAKAQYLKDFKQLLLDRDCSVTVNKNKVGLVAGALRSEGLVIAISEKNPGNYWGYHQAPKPEFLDRATGYTKSLIVSGRLAYADAADPAKATHIGVYIAKPVQIKEAENMYIYDKSFHSVALSDSSTASVTGKSTDGSSVTLECSAPK